MLDTDTISFAMRGQGGVAARIVEHRPSDLCISAISVAELRFGAARRKSAKLHAMIDGLLSNFAVMPFEESSAGEYGEVASLLAARGLPIGGFDALIAAHAISLGVTLVTNNVKHFARVRGLTVANWF